ncbi:hypothetical protein OKW30_007404 [Paraburkholderia sp. Clong3]|uniref:hypothetical protein n=1 Tax=Paraburkholderia sp. Clong3 TaxID=2991061 RepID=UPI003D1FCADE
MNTASNTDNEQTSAMGLARYAYEYIEAAHVVDEQIGSQNGYELVSPIPAYFLAMHGIELTLKAFLRHQGIGVHALSNPREYGHDLHGCFRKAKELGLLDVFTMRVGDADAMDMLVALNHRQGLRYIRTGKKHFPLWSIVERLAVRLHQAVAPIVGCKTFDVTFGQPPQDSVG